MPRAMHYIFSKGASASTLVANKSARIGVEDSNRHTQNFRTEFYPHHTIASIKSDATPKSKHHAKLCGTGTGGRELQELLLGACAAAFTAPIPNHFHQGRRQIHLQPRCCDRCLRHLPRMKQRQATKVVPVFLVPQHGGRRLPTTSRLNL